MMPHPLISFEIQKFYQDEPRFNGIYSKSDFAKRQDGHMS